VYVYVYVCVREREREKERERERLCVSAWCFERELLVGSTQPPRGYQGPAN
jgi:hypothetical protein